MVKLVEELKGVLGEELYASTIKGDEVVKMKDAEVVKFYVKDAEVFGNALSLVKDLTPITVEFVDETFEFNKEEEYQMAY